MKTSDRREHILSAAIDLSLEIGYQHITRDGVAVVAKVSGALVNMYFGTIEKLKKQVIKAAIDREVIEIVAQGLGMRDPDIVNAPEEIKKKAIKYLSI